MGETQQAEEAKCKLGSALISASSKASTLFDNRISSVEALHDIIDTSAFVAVHAR